MPAPTGYIDDYAGVISAPAKTDLETTCRDLHDKTKAQFFVVTVKTLEGEPIETFANELFRKWKIGDKKENRGVLLLLAVKDHKRRIETGYGEEGILNDAKAGDIGREMVPDLKASNYDGALKIAVNRVASIIAADAGATLQAAADTSGETAHAPEPPPSQPMPLGAKLVLISMCVLFFGGILTMIFFIVRAARNSRSNSPTSGDTGTSSGFMTSDISTTSSDSGSSSDSFSGGDGGDSGGGGASGDW